jgi:hypothetical protein
LMQMQSMAQIHLKMLKLRLTISLANIVAKFIRV